jgi:hypothetical protein
LDRAFIFSVSLQADIILSFLQNLESFRLYLFVYLVVKGNGLSLGCIVA